MSPASLDYGWLGVCWFRDCIMISFSLTKIASRSRSSFGASGLTSAMASLRVPPLRDREGDVPLLAARFLAKFAAAANKRIEGLHPAAREHLERHRYPGNVRELQNAIERAVAFCQGGVIRLEHLPPRLLKKPAQGGDPDGVATAIGIDSDSDSLPTLEEVEQRYIRHVVQKTGGNKRLAASILGIARRTLYRRIG